jgi:hypothetical protein
VDAVALPSLLFLSRILLFVSGVNSCAVLLLPVLVSRRAVQLAGRRKSRCLLLGNATRSGALAWVLTPLLPILKLFMLGTL